MVFVVKIFFKVGFKLIGFRINYYGFYKCCDFFYDMDSFVIGIILYK